MLTVNVCILFDTLNLHLSLECFFSFVRRWLLFFVTSFIWLTTQLALALRGNCTVKTENLLKTLCKSQT